MDTSRLKFPLFAPPLHGQKLGLSGEPQPAYLREALWLLFWQYSVDKQVQSFLERPNMHALIMNSSERVHCIRDPETKDSIPSLLIFEVPQGFPDVESQDPYLSIEEWRAMDPNSFTYLQRPAAYVHQVEVGPRKDEFNFYNQQKAKPGERYPGRDTSNYVSKPTPLRPIREYFESDENVTKGPPKMPRKLKPSVNVAGRLGIRQTPPAPTPTVYRPLKQLCHLDPNTKKVADTIEESKQQWGSQKPPRSHQETIRGFIKNQGRAETTQESATPSEAMAVTPRKSAGVQKKKSPASQAWLDRRRATIMGPPFAVARDASPVKKRKSLSRLLPIARNIEQSIQNKRRNTGSVMCGGLKKMRNRMRNTSPYMPVTRRSTNQSPAQRPVSQPVTEEEKIDLWESIREKRAVQGVSNSEPVVYAPRNTEIEDYDEEQEKQEKEEREARIAMAREARQMQNTPQEPITETEVEIHAEPEAAVSEEVTYRQRFDSERSEPLGDDPSSQQRFGPRHRGAHNFTVDELAEFGFEQEQIDLINMQMQNEEDMERMAPRRGSFDSDDMFVPDILLDELEPIFPNEQFWTEQNQPDLDSAFFGAFRYDDEDDNTGRRTRSEEIEYWPDEYYQEVPFPARRITSYH